MTQATLEKAKAIAEAGLVHEAGRDTWLVESSNPCIGSYTVSRLGGSYRCECKGYRYRGRCKHIEAVQQAEGGERCQKCGLREAFPGDVYCVWCGLK